MQTLQKLKQSGLFCLRFVAIVAGTSRSHYRYQLAPSDCKIMTHSNAASIQTLQAVDPSVVRLVQITDCHIQATAQDRLKGMNTRASLEAICQSILADNDDLDLVLATGDLSQDGSVASYEYLAQQLSELQLPVHWLPGNHDDPGVMHEQLDNGQLSAAKQVLIGNWLIVLLDSTIKGESAGDISPQQLDFLHRSLRTHPQHHVLVCLHHQAMPTGSAWIDRLGLQQPQALQSAIKAQPNVRAVLWGHVHQQSHHYRDGIEWLSSPSTCVQFKPGSDEFALDNLPPGYRQLNLYADGSIDTRVARLASFDFDSGFDFDTADERAR
jgi:Icc protein